MHNKRMPAEKPKDFKASIKKLVKYSKDYYTLIIMGLAFAFIGSVLSIIGPDKLKEITNVVTEGLMTKIDLDKIKSLGIILILMYAFSFIFSFLEGVLMAKVTSKFSRKLRSELSNKINRLPLSYFDKTTVGDVLSRMTNDIDSIGQTLNQSLGTLVSAITMFIGTLFMMFKTSPSLAIAAVTSSLVGFAIMSVILSRSQKYFTAVQNELGNLNGHIEEVYSGNTIVKVYNASDEMLDEFNEINDRLYENGRKSQFLSGLMGPFMGFVSNIGYVTVCILGSILVVNGSIKFGVIVAFMIYVRLFTNPLSQFAQSMAQLQTTAAASERVFDILEAEEESDESKINRYLDKSIVKGDIEFKNVKFGYNKDELVIKDFNASIKAGSKVAIVGPTGAGKTTLVNLLMKFYELNSGDIYIDGVSTKELTRENVHDLFVMVLQDTWLFQGSIKENIRFNDETITDNEISSACQVVGLDHFIKTLPKGYDTVLNETDDLSQGQKQLLTIARGMVDDSPFLILDEATSSVDTRTEKLVQEAMDKLTTGRTSFIIAHRLSTIRNADLILVIKDGNIVEQGNHDELLKLNGVYAETYNSQFQNVSE